MDDLSLISKPFKRTRVKILVTLRTSADSVHHTNGSALNRGFPASMLVSVHKMSWPNVHNDPSEATLA